MKITHKLTLALLQLTIAFAGYSQTHIISNGATVTWYKIGSLSGVGANVSIRLTSTPGYGSLENAKGESWGRVAIGNSADEFTGWFTQVGGSNATPNSLGWVKTGATDIDVYLLAHTYNIGTLHVFDGYGFTSSFSSTTTNPSITSVANQFTIVTGNVGIGTSSPGEKLEIGGDSKVNLKLGSWGSLGITGGGLATVLGNNVRVSSSINNQLESMTTTSDGGKAIKMQYDEGISFHTFRGSVTNGSAFSGHERMRIDNDGNVGIGTTTPGANLHVSTTGQAAVFGDASFVDHYLSIRNNVAAGVNFGLDISAAGGSGAGLIQTGSAKLFQISTGVNGAFGSGTPDFTIDVTGNVGIGTISPGSILDVANNGESVLRVTDNTASEYTELIQRASDGNFDISRVGTGNVDFSIRKDGDLTMAASTGGNVGIGTTTPDQKLTVKGKIHAEEVIVDLSVPGPDYVFADNYPLTTLKEVADYIQQNKHLPEIPSAKEMEANGIALGTMNMLLLKKIEELTLYTLEQKKEIEQSKAQNDSMSVQIASLLGRLEKLEAVTKAKTGSK